MMRRLWRWLARLLALIRQIDGQDLILVAGMGLLAAGLWMLAGQGVATAVIGALLLVFWAWSLKLAARPPDRRR